MTEILSYLKVDFVVEVAVMMKEEEKADHEPLQCQFKGNQNSEA
jgi:hypothetical protein